MGVCASVSVTTDITSWKNRPLYLTASSAYHEAALQTNRTRVSVHVWFSPHLHTRVLPGHQKNNEHAVRWQLRPSKCQAQCRSRGATLPIWTFVLHPGGCDFRATRGRSSKKQMLGWPHHFMIMCRPSDYFAVFKSRHMQIRMQRWESHSPRACHSACRAV